MYFSTKNYLKNINKSVASEKSVSSKIFENPMDIVLASLYFIFFICNEIIIDLLWLSQYIFFKK